MKNRILTGTLIGLFGFVLTVSAQQGPPMDRPMRQPALDELKLTDQQKKDIEKIHSDAQKEQIDRRAEIAKARIELKDLFKADNPSQSAIEKKMNDIAALENQARSRHLNIWFSINKMLTPEQQQVWKKTLERHAAMGSMQRQMRRSGRMGMMGGRGGMQRNMNRQMPMRNRDMR